MKKLLTAGLLVPIALLVCLELTLRASGAGRPVSLFIEREIDGRGEMTANHLVGWRYFPGTIARRPLSEHFPKDKQPDTVRVFILGESAARGESLADFSFGRMLRVLLQAAYPEKRFEVINTGIPGINSWVLREFAAEISRYTPDIVIFYGGHNEILGPYGPASAFSLPSSRGFTRFRLWLSGLMLAQVPELLTGTRLTPAATVASGGWRGLEMFLEKRLGPDDPGVRAATRNFEGNLIDMIRSARQAGARFIACATPANLADSGPFASVAEAPPELRGVLVREAADALEGAAVPDGLVSRIAEALKQEPRDAGLQFLRGKLLMKAGRFEEARTAFEMARQCDALRFRTTPELNGAIASAVAAFPGDAGVKLLDLEQAFSKASAGGICGRELFYDHVHLTLDGHWKAANDLFDALSGGFAPALPASPAVRLTREETLARLGYTSREELHDLEAILAALGRPPLTARIGNDEQRKRLAEAIARLRQQLTPEALSAALASVSATLRTPGADPQLAGKAAGLATDAGFPSDALAQYDAALAANPWNIDNYNNRGLIRFGLQDLDGAVRDFQTALELAPNFAGARFNLGAAWAKSGKTEAAREAYEAALAIDPGLTKARLNLANLLLQSGKATEAIREYENGLAISPDSAELAYGLGNALLKSDKPGEALERFEQAVHANPDDGLAHYGAARALLALGREATAAAHLREAATRCPDQPAVLQLAATVLATSDHPGAADPAAAVGFAKRAVELTGRSQPEPLQVLGVACAAAGKIGEARAALAEALPLAQACGDRALAGEIQGNLRQLEGR
ncbi:MAG TPA: tetratricopeptide repeat protein [Candidatus Ozemobacteraceae bacterium]|nr:tetratricopeptide repeat protein [Candidatus Ozemobacteraceae bacterium]